MHPSMHEYSTSTRDAIIRYLNKEFPSFEVLEDKNEDSYCFKLKGETGAYYLRVMFTAIQSDQQQSIEDLLGQYAAADTMRGLGDFPVVVTEQGCMFGSP
jgi:hypothetical protein